MSLDIKICGLSTPDAIDAAAAGGASHAGFIFFEKSPRNVTPDDAAPLVARARAAGVATVAVTVDADDDTLDRIVRTSQRSRHCRDEGRRFPSTISGRQPTGSCRCQTERIRASGRQWRQL
jgi:hypothetical protein